MDNVSLNTFVREHFNTLIRFTKNSITHDPGTTKEHRKLVVDVCEWALENKLLFFTRVFLKEGKIVDVVIPELAKPFVEIRNSELKKDKEYLDKHKDLIQFIDTTDPFKLR